MDHAIIEKEALQLSDTERAVLADRLLESLSMTPSEITEAWIQEADDRMKAFRDGEIAAIDGTRAMAELRSKFAK
tara:strand:- start:5340 stop:5564 length:225 start_codon:yes stop_codon:yes gene_type:complete